jgi:2-polyprenyl-3-methyl-5-hydroxy-6-metoxy-1,4-benzoquinol methylase
MRWPRGRSFDRNGTGGSPLEIEALRENWEELARSIPMRSILWRQRPWEAEEFFATGRAQVDRSMTTLRELGIEPTGRALDFGCGVGRLTQALAGHFDEVVGVDVAAPMIEQAKDYNRYGERCRYVVNAADDLRQFQDASFDFVFSVIVLQHVGTALAMRYIAEFARVLRPRGVAMFQVPSEIVSVLPLAQAAMGAELELIEPPVDDLENLPSASLVSLRIRVRNASSEPWLPEHRLIVAGKWRERDGRGVVDSEQGPRTPLALSIDAGASTEIVAEVSLPSEPGPHVLEFDVHQVGLSWFSEYGSRILAIPISVVGDRAPESTAASRAGEPERAIIAPPPRIEMHPVPRAEVLRILQAGGAEPVAVLDDSSAGYEWISFTYVAQRRSAGPRRWLRGAPAPRHRTAG